MDFDHRDLGLVLTWVVSRDPETVLACSKREETALGVLPLRASWLYFVRGNS